MSDWWKSKQPWLHVNANIDHTLVRPGAKRLWQLRQFGVGFNISIQHPPKTEPISLWKSSTTLFLAWTFAISRCVFSSPPTPPLQPWCVFAFRKHTIVPKLTLTEMALIWSTNENLNQCSEANNDFSPRLLRIFSSATWSGHWKTIYWWFWIRKQSILIAFSINSNCTLEVQSLLFQFLSWCFFLRSSAAPIVTSLW